MLQVEADKVIEQMRELYPGWNPTATEIEAVRFKFRDYALQDAKEAVLTSYEPGKRVAPLEAVFGACARKVIAQKEEAKRRAAAEGATRPRPVATDEQKRQMLIQGAEDGNELCMALCRKKGIAFTLKEIPI